MQYSIYSDISRTILKFWGRFHVREKERQQFFEAFQQAQSKNKQEIIIDLREVTFIDSSAIGLLMVAHTRCQTTAVALKLCISEGNVKLTLDYLDIPTLIPVLTEIGCMRWVN